MNKQSKLAPYYMFEQNKKFYLFDGSSGTINEIQQVLYDILQLSRNYNIFTEMGKEKTINLLEGIYPQVIIQDVIEQLLNNYNNGFLHSNNKLYDVYERNSVEELKGQCLWLNISHDCNLRCVYCFGHGGDYGNKKMLMSTEIAKKCIDLWLSKVVDSKKLYEVNFFGGEPLINQKTLEFCINYINEQTKRKRITVRYNLTTNGTLLNETIKSIFKRNNFKVSVSVDGIDTIHNANRPYISGKGSYDDIVKNINILREILPNLSVQITLTKKDISFLKKAVIELWNLGIAIVYSNLVFDKSEIYSDEDYAIYQKEVNELAELTFKNLIEGRRQVYQNLINIMWTIHKRVCTANCFYWTGGAMIFSPEGKSYSCYRFIENSEFLVGDVKNSKINLNTPKKEKNKVCSKCWAQLYCGDGCVYENNVYSDTLDLPAKEWCAKTKIYLEEGMKMYVKLKNEAPDIFNKIFKIGGKI